MKSIIFPFFLLLLFGLSSCDDNLSETVTFRINEPVFMDAETFRSSVKVSSEVHEITGYGKISYYNGYLFMSEPGKGIHIINNQDPTNPQVVGYIELLGNADISVRNNLLYADSYIDLVWFDVSNPAQPELKGRLENVFPEAIPFVDNGWGIDYLMSYGDDSKGKVIVGWKEVERTVPVDQYGGHGWFWRGWFRGDALAFSEKNFDASTGGNSINGSMSRFSIYGQDIPYLYVVINNYMQIFDLSKAEPERVVENFYIGWNVETIFSYKDHMFMGTPTGMLIYSVEDPVKPVYKSSITHAFGCDPVVVEDDIAYVTIRSGNECGQDENKLIVIDVSNTSKPKELVSYGMTGPKGLGIDNKTLFVCDDGLKVFDATNPMTIMANQLAHFKDMDGFDVIPFNNVLMMIADNGIYQYDYSNPKDIKPIPGSFIPVNQPQE
jgi:hypothetical protein